MKRSATAMWQGTGLEGKGTLTTQSGALDGRPYSVLTRFRDEQGVAGTNPEELLAAAHAGCFTMALSFWLAGAGFPPEELRTEAILTMHNEGVHWTITAVHLSLQARVPGIPSEQFQELAGSALVTCPVSKVLKAEITLDARLVPAGERTEPGNRRR